MANTNCVRFLHFVQPKPCQLQCQWCICVLLDARNAEFDALLIIWPSIGIQGGRNNKQLALGWMECLVFVSTNTFLSWHLFAITSMASAGCSTQSIVDPCLAMPALCHAISGMLWPSSLNWDWELDIFDKKAMIPTLYGPNPKWWWRRQVANGSHWCSHIRLNKGLML